MHYEVNLSEEDMLKLLDKLRVGYELSIQFFSLHIENIESKLLRQDMRSLLTII